MERAEINQGKERARQMLIAPLEADGFGRGGKSVADYEAWKERLLSAVCYMTEDELDTLRHAIPAMAKLCSKCNRREGWPSIQAIRSQAHAIAPPPLSANPKVRSYMHSRAGQGALEQGEHVAVALMLYLQTHRYVPDNQNRGWSVIRRHAEELRGRAETRSMLIAEDRAVDADRERQQNYERAVAMARSLVAGETAEREQAA